MAGDNPCALPVKEKELLWPNQLCKLRCKPIRQCVREPACLSWFLCRRRYIEVHKANEPQDGTFLVPYSRMSDLTSQRFFVIKRANRLSYPRERLYIG